MTTGTPERLIWAVEQLAARPHDRVLEIGCGRGYAAALLCPHLKTGHLTGVDRSATAIAAARRLNRVWVASGRAEFRSDALAEADFGGERFDKALAVNVNAFWREPAAEMQALRAVLKPSGVLCLVYQPPAASRMQPIADACARALQQQGFSRVEVRFREPGPRPIVSIVSCMHALR
jgi:SAM-dependent methyltransferase